MKQPTSTVRPAADDPPPSAPPFAEDPLLRARLERILSGQEPPPTLTPPPEVLQLLQHELARLPDMPEETQQRLLADWSLMYYHGGQHVLTWMSPQGLAVLAVGTEEIARALQHLSPDRWEEVLERFAEPWWSGPCPIEQAPVCGCAP